MAHLISLSCFPYDFTKVKSTLSEEKGSWLGGDTGNRLGGLNMWGGAAWLSGLVATLALLPE